ncbi:MAG: hypothetical protein COW65_00075, partial [Cytophagales bacterium CG18_big_fil_WC_8_21_14_2_50_42_9]
MEENKKNEAISTPVGATSSANNQQPGTENQENKISKDNSMFNQGNTLQAGAGSTPGENKEAGNADKKEDTANKLFGKKKESSTATAQAGTGANKNNKTGIGAPAITATAKSKEVKAGTKDKKEASAQDKTADKNTLGKAAADQNKSDEFEFGRTNTNMGLNSQAADDKNTHKDEEEHRQIPGEFGRQSYNDHDNFGTDQRGSWGNQGGSYGHQQGDTFSRNQDFQGNYDYNQNRGQRGNYGYEAYDNEGSGYQSASRG